MAQSNDATGARPVTDAQSARLKKRFLERFALCGNITRACELAGIKRRRVIYEWQEHDDEFALAMQQADVEATEHLEAEAWRRASSGVVTETPLLYRGKVIRTIVETKYSDTLLIFLLKARAPEKYRDRFDIRLTAQQHAERLAREFGVPVEDVLAEAEALLKSRAG